MKRIARFEKVSFGQFSEGWDDTFQGQLLMLLGR